MWEKTCISLHKRILWSVGVTEIFVARGERKGFCFSPKMEGILWLCWVMGVSFVVGSEVIEYVIMILSSVYMKYALHLIKGV